MPGAVAPLIVLCGHRSGSSLFTSLLVGAGLYVGEVLPAQFDNPAGYFENRDVVAINSRLLAERGRDWTCPPPWFDHQSVDLAPLEEVANRLRAAGHPWGFKDPRTLFTLPAWAAALGPCRLVGVHRNSTDVASSLVERDGLTSDQARAIADAHAQRLAEAHKLLGFPIVSFDDDIEQLVQRAATVAEFVGLNLDMVDAIKRYECELVHHRSDGAPRSATDEYLAEAATKHVTALRHHEPSTLAAICRRVPSSLAENLRCDVGPQYAARRAAMFRRAIDRLPDVGHVAVLEPEQRTIDLLGTPIYTRTMAALRESTAEGVANGERWSHVVAPKLLDDTAPADLHAAFDLLALRLDATAIVATSGWVVDSTDIPFASVFQPSGVRATRDAPPYLHHLDEIATALRRRRLYVAGVEYEQAGRSRLFVTNDRSLESHEVSGPLVRATLVTMEQRVLHLETANGDLRAELATRDRALAAADHRADAGDRRADAAAHALADAQEQRRRAEQATAAACDAYRRLASRRIVRLGLLIARPMRPVYRAVRRTR